MAANILVVDTVATNRIVMRVKLSAARYNVDLAPSLDLAVERIDRARPDLVLLDVSADTAAALAFCADLKADPARAGLPVIALGQFDDPDCRLAALAAGADDVLPKPVHDVMLEARIRSLLRIRDTDAELRLREDTRRALGFAEQTPGFEPAGRVTLVAPAGDADRRGALHAALPGGVIEDRTPRDVLGWEVPPGGTDLFVLDAAAMSPEEIARDVFRLVPELRSRREWRHAAQLVILPPGLEREAAMTLDLGASDVAMADVSFEELRLRAGALLRNKRQQDLLRNNLRDGLRAAVTDQLTGLHNRRYALPHLDRLAEQAVATSRVFAVMVLDIDHFKAVNDQWGHAVGDRVLAAVAARLRGHLRPVDMIARIGGEEFLVAMPDTCETVAREAAQRICAAMETEPFIVAEKGLSLTVTLSIGLAMGAEPGRAPEDAQTLVARADAALYSAKAAGRNRVGLSVA